MLKNLLNRILSAQAAAPAAPAKAASALPTAPVLAAAPVAMPAAGELARADALIAEGNALVDAGDLALADAIHADGIDVLVDLMGHTGHARPAVFCQRPAPVQVGWLGYLNTTGLTRMDFRLCDVRTDPPATSQPLHTERLVALPESQWCYQAIGEIAIDPVAPVERNGHVTFGSFNAAAKVTPATCRRWGQILLRVPQSRLRRHGRGPGLRSHDAGDIAARAAAAPGGLAADRHRALHARPRGGVPDDVAREDGLSPRVAPLSAPRP